MVAREFDCIEFNLITRRAFFCINFFYASAECVLHVGTLFVRVSCVLIIVCVRHVSWARLACGAHLLSIARLLLVHVLLFCARHIVDARLLLVHVLLFCARHC